MYYRQIVLIENGIKQWLSKQINESNGHTLALLAKQLVTLSKTLFAYYIGVLSVSMCTLICFILYPYVANSDLIMIYLLGVVVVATFQGEEWHASILAALLSTIAFDFFFTPPRFDLSIAYGGDIITLLVMFVVAQVISHLTTRIRRVSDATKKVQMQAETERFRNILLMSVSHDLRTPLTAIMGSASSLLQAKDKLDENSKNELMQNIYDESKHLNRLVSNILQIMRLESGPIKISKQLHVLEEVIGSALNNLEKSLAMKPINIQLPKVVPLVALDDVLMEQVLVNLIENSIKFSPTESPIDILVELEDNKVMVKIADRGPGLDPKDMEKIFDRFYQGQKPEMKGVGLGLALCKSVIQAHDGRIWAVNRKGGGAVFCFTLPIAAEKVIDDRS